MKNPSLVKIAVIAIGLAVGFLGFAFTPRIETQTLNSVNTPEKIVSSLDEIKDYKNWTKVNDKPHIMFSEVSALCRAPLKSEIEKEIHKDKYITVYVNAVGKDEMLTKKSPKFPVGTVIVKEKLPMLNSTSPELLTVMIKREKGFNGEVGDWEFMTVSGNATAVTAKGKLESCQMCHINYDKNDYISRQYLSEEQQENLK
jgi:hypothetical protein